MLVPRSSLQHTSCSSGGRFSFGCDNIPRRPKITQHAATIWSVCSLFTYLLNCPDKNCFKKLTARNLTCLFQSIERIIIQLLELTKIMTSTKLHLMKWPLITHFRRKKRNNMFKILYIHIHFYYIYSSIIWVLAVWQKYISQKVHKFLHFPTYYVCEFKHTHYMFLR